MLPVTRRNCLVSSRKFLFANRVVTADVLSSADVHQDEWKISEPASWDEPSEKLSSEEWEDSDAVLRNRLGWMFLIVLVVATSAIFASVLWQRALLNADSRDITSLQTV